MPPPTPAPASPSWPKDFAAFVARLHGDAASGRDPDLAAHADLLEALERRTLAASSEAEIERVPELEEAGRARQGRGTGWATIATYLEPAADPDALRAVYLDFDRVAEWTGKPGTRTLGRDGDTVLGSTDGVRSALGRTYGARWRFRARPLDRGPARLVVTTMVPSDDAMNLLETHALLILFPEGSGVRVVEIAATVVDFEVPALVRSLAIASALKEMRARIAGLRGHWREYLRPRR